MVPLPFRARRALRVLSVAAVGLALASVTSAVSWVVFDHSSELAFATAAPTWLVGTMWAGLMRLSGAPGKPSVRAGWAASVPLAALNAALVGGLLMDHLSGKAMSALGFLLGALFGATFGAMFWMPALGATLLCFGFPIARAKRLAGEGLAGEERGDWIVGLACVVLGLTGAAVALPGLSRALPANPAAGWISVGVGCLGALTGGAAAALARAREMRRRRFVADVEAGKVAGFRVDPTPAGKVLVRVVSRGGGYRVADFEQEVFELDAAGEATRAVQSS